MRIVIGDEPVRNVHAATGPHLGEPPLPRTAAQIEARNAPDAPDACPTCGRALPHPINRFATGAPQIAVPTRQADDLPDPQHSPELADHAGEPTPGDVLRERYGYRPGVPAGIPNPDAVVRGEEFEDVTVPATQIANSLPPSPGRVTTED